MFVVPTTFRGPGSGTGTGGGIPKVAVIGIAAAGVIIVTFVSVVIVMKNQRHKRRQKELDPNVLFGHFHNPPSPSPLTHITSGHNQHQKNNNHHHHHDDQYPDNDDGHYDQGGTHQHEMEQFHDTGGGQGQGQQYNQPSGNGQGVGDTNQYTHGGGQGQGVNDAGGHYTSGQGQGIGDSGGNYNPGQGQGVGDTGGHYGQSGGQGLPDQGQGFYDSYGGHDTGYNHGGGHDFGYGQGQVDPSSAYGGGGSGGGAPGAGGGGIGGGGAAPQVQPMTSLSGYPSYPVGAVPPPVPFLNRPSTSNRISVNPSNTSAAAEYALLDLTAIPAPHGSSSTSYRPLDRFISNTSRSSHAGSNTGGGGNSPIPPPRPGSSTVTHATWDESAQEYRSDRPLSQASVTSQPYQQLGSPIMFQDFFPPPVHPPNKSPRVEPVLPATTSNSTAGVRRSVGAPQDRGPEMLASPITSGHPSDLNAFERRAPQTQDNAHNSDSLFNVVASTLRQPQGAGS
ncbi:hypothetical protein BGX23_003908 [Mortierella sp. AD031]|nr:hypothetical protein BGX23_003908 [Mortierella sp. AD031]